jgi:hypothetical protein
LPTLKRARFQSRTALGVLSSARASLVPRLAGTLDAPNGRRGFYHQATKTKQSYDVTRCSAIRETIK